jgi:hypothetical protein
MFRPLTISAAALALGGCPANNNGDAPMVVLNNSAVTQGSTTCTLSGDPNQPFTSQGVISTLSPVPYLLTPLIESRITALAGQESQRTISLQGADVTLSSSVALPSTSFQSLASGFLAPNGGTTNVTINLVPVDDITAIANTLGTNPGSVEVVASVTLFGLLGGDRVDAVLFQYGVTVCNNCVVFDNGACPLTVTTARLGNPCNVFQDGNVDCCRDGNNALVCPGTL